MAWGLWLRIAMFMRMLSSSGMKMARYYQAMPDRSRKRPRDPSQLGKLIVDIATGDVEDTAPDDGKNPAAVELGRKGGLKGGRARAERMTAEERSKAAQRAARARWTKG